MRAFRQRSGKQLQQRQRNAQEGSTAALAGVWFCSKDSGSGTHMAMTEQLQRPSEQFINGRQSR